MVLQDSALLVAAALWPLSAYLFPSAPLCRRRQAAHSAKAGLLSRWRLAGPGTGLAARPCLGSSILL